MAVDNPSGNTVRWLLVAIAAIYVVTAYVLARRGFKLGAGTFDPATGTFQPRRVADADFAGVRFDYRQAFGRRVLSGGQLVAMLGRSMLNQDFYQAFFLGHFVVLVQPADAGETTAWFVEQAPSEPVRRAFLDCLKGLSSPG